MSTIKLLLQDKIYKIAVEKSGLDYEGLLDLLSKKFKRQK
jgi:hypothetical protein